MFGRYRFFVWLSWAIAFLVVLAGFYLLQTLGLFLNLFYLPLRRLFDKFGGLEEEEVRRKTDEFMAKLPPPMLFLLRLWAWPTLLIMRFVQKLLGMDEDEFERAKRALEDIDHFIGRDRFD